MPVSARQAARERPATMRVGIIQSNYLPWRGYFDIIDDVDLFLLHDDLQFTKGDWRNRNRLRTPQGSRWFTVPVHYRHTAQRIAETEIDYTRDWRREHAQLLRTHLGSAPFVADVLDLVVPEFEARPETISALNAALIRRVCRYLGIATRIRFTSEFAVTGAKTERLLALLTATGATTYLSGPSAAAYLDEARLAGAGIRLEYKQYDYPAYPQVFEGFDGAVSVVDLIANCGPAARDLMTSRSASVRAA